MALNAYLNVKGQKQGQFKGSVTQKGRENTILVIAASHEIVSPRDAASGLPTGKRMHQPLTITIELDSSAPQFYTAFATNESLTDWLLTFYRADPTGAEKEIYTIKLTNASIASIEFVLPNTRDPNLAKQNEYEQIAFTYEKIEWTWVDGGISAMDSWTQRA